MPAPAPANSEWLTRKRIVDEKLRAAGWEICPFRKNRRFSIFTSAPSENATMFKFIAAIR